jgi:peptidoglycan/xylan/chitin deacetylase (PgdA/CDA1 family)
VSAGWKPRLKRTLFALGSAPGLRPLRWRWLAAVGRVRAVVVVYHRVSDEIRGEGQQLTVGVAAFRRHLALYRRNFHVVPIADLVGLLRGGGRPAPWTLAITFDDGYRDNYLAAAPLLREHGLPACFFLSAGYVGTERRFPWDVEDGVNAGIMSWTEARHLAELGFEIGAHTVHHRDLGRAGADDFRTEIVPSRRIIEDRIGRPAPYFSYPFGGPGNHSPAARHCVKDAGFHCAFVAHGGPVRAWDDLFLLPRIAISPHYDSALSVQMELEAFFDWRAYLGRRAAEAGA